MVFVDACEDLIMADDVVAPSNPPITLVKEEELEETPFDVNVSQRPHNEKPFERVIHIRVDNSAWDHQLYFNLHALVIYLKFVLACGAAPERFEECQCENDDVHLHYQTWVPSDGHYRWL